MRAHWATGHGTGEIRRLTAVARDGKATPADLGRGTFPLNKYGAFGMESSANHPKQDLDFPT